MEYKVLVSKNLGDIVPLLAVVEAMAIARATAYGSTEFHQPTYDGARRAVVPFLHREAMNGTLLVCNQFGFVASAAQVIEDAKSMGTFSVVTEPDWQALKAKYPERSVSGGVWNWNGIDLGDTEDDTVESELLCLYSTLKHLNDWGAHAGNSFSLDPSAPWIDERGVIKVVGGNETDNAPTVPRQRYQEQEILRVIRQLGHDPKALPVLEAGKPGVKAEVRKSLEFSPTVFEKAWERLRAAEEIEDAPSKPTSKPSSP